MYLYQNTTFYQCTVKVFQTAKPFSTSENSECWEIWKFLGNFRILNHVWQAHYRERTEKSLNTLLLMDAGKDLKAKMKRGYHSTYQIYVYQILVLLCRKFLIAGPFVSRSIRTQVTDSV